MVSAQLVVCVAFQFTQILNLKSVIRNHKVRVLDKSTSQTSNFDHTSGFLSGVHIICRDYCVVSELQVLRSSTPCFQKFREIIPFAVVNAFIKLT